MSSRYAKQRLKGFTLIELLVVVAIIAMLISILLPSLKRAREQAKKAVCLSNLHQIGMAAHEYASEDERDQIMPISPIMVRRQSGKWHKRCAMWYSWGGRGAPLRLMTKRNKGIWINEGNDKPYHGTRQRPLTTYMYPTVEESRPDPDDVHAYIATDLPVFHCPADVGFPDLPSGVIDDAPPANAGNAMYDTVGNSYRGSLCCLKNPRQEAEPDRFSLGVWGQRLDGLENTSNLVWGGDPLFYNFIGTDAPGQGWPEVKKYGWHGEFMIDNELYADASARPTQAVSEDDPSWRVTGANAEAWGISARNAPYLRRGPSWQLDAFPTPGVKFDNPNLDDRMDKFCWPYQGHTVTPPPTGGWE